MPEAQQCYIFNRVVAFVGGHLMHPYAGFDRDEPEPAPPDPRVAQTEHALRAAEAENQRLRATVRNLESALKIVGKVALPYANRALPRR
jgi:hypothetical protein